MNRYTALGEYYRSCFALVDMFHFNSRVTADVYRHHLSQPEGVVVPITHGGITDRRRLHRFGQGPLKVGFIGSTSPYKGYHVLKSALCGLGDDKSWQLLVYGGKEFTEKTHPIFHKGRFSAREQEKVYTYMDVLVVPSLWKETFSLCALEALSFGTPVIVSGNVGAQTIIAGYSPSFVFRTNEELSSLLSELTTSRQKLIDFNREILRQPWSFDIKTHAAAIREQVYCQPVPRPTGDSVSQR